jgi:hypothetical protein
MLLSTRRNVLACVGHKEVDIGKCPFRALIARAAHKHVQGRNHSEIAAPPRKKCGSQACQYWKKLETPRVSGNFPRRYYPDRVQRDSLSLVARFSVPSSRETRAEAPLFRQQTLKHKNETGRKRGALKREKPERTAAFVPFVEAAHTLAQCRDRQCISLLHGYSEN